MNMLTRATDSVRSPGDPKVIESGPSSRAPEDNMAKRLGWFSLALGMTELIWAKPMARALGLEGREGLLRAYGVREIGSGMLCLSPDTKPGMWSRVAGDMLDIATLMTADTDREDTQRNHRIALGAVVGVTLLDLWTASAIQQRHSRSKGEQRLYNDRSGWPKGIEHSRGAASTLRKPSDMRAAPADAKASPVSGETSTGTRPLERKPELAH